MEDPWNKYRSATDAELPIPGEMTISDPKDRGTKNRSQRSISRKPSLSKHSYGFYAAYWRNPARSLKS